jgi:hypothetical protein
MFYLRRLATITAIALLVGTGAKGATFDLDFSATTTLGTVLTGDFVLTTPAVSGIMGITGASGTYTVAGTPDQTYTVSGVSFAYGADDYLYYPFSPHFDTDGVAFTATTGNSPIWLYYDSAVAGYEFYDGGYETLTSLSVSPAATPLPAALVLFATGIGTLGLLGRRKNRSRLAI